MHRTRPRTTVRRRDSLIGLDPVSRPAEDRADLALPGGIVVGREPCDPLLPAPAEGGIGGLEAPPPLHPPDLLAGGIKDPHGAAGVRPTDQRAAVVDGADVFPPLLREGPEERAPGAVLLVFSGIPEGVEEPLLHPGTERAADDLLPAEEVAAREPLLDLDERIACVHAALPTEVTFKRRHPVDPLCSRE